MPDHRLPSVRRVLTGWGRTAPSGADVVVPLTVEDVQEWLVRPPGRGVLARGLGRSYGDAAQNAGGAVLDMPALNAIRDADLEHGIVTADAGLSLDQLMRRLIPAGWFPHVTPGTRFVTIGGAIAADVHGKNHHVDGTIADGVERLVLGSPTGSHELDPRDELFWATVGGMGLTGVITEVTLRLRRIRSSLMRVDTERCVDLDDVLDRMESGDHRYRYSVAWIDGLGRGRSLGRAVLTRGDHADADALPPQSRSEPLSYRTAVRLAAPRWVPDGLLNPSTVRAFNELWFRLAPVHRVGELQTIPSFFHPLDAVARWNRMYGTSGFLQYQFVVPFGAESTLVTILERLSTTRVPSFLAVLKRFGPTEHGYLSFPIPGWTLALDIPVGDPRLTPLLRAFDDAVAEAGGRVYLAKDARVSAVHIAAMYPDLERWRTVRHHVDPERVLRSDLDRRLQLVDGGTL